MSNATCRTRIASNLRGFVSSSLRVIETRRDGDYVWVTTADLRDTGTKLVLDASQISDLPEEYGQRHREGLVTFA